jgi:hypothetical protein
MLSDFILMILMIVCLSPAASQRSCIPNVESCLLVIQRLSAAGDGQRYGATIWQQWFEKLVTKHILFPRLN